MVFLIERVGGQSAREETGEENGKPGVLLSVPKEPREVRRAWMVCRSHYREAPYSTPCSGSGWWLTAGGSSAHWRCCR